MQTKDELEKYIAELMYYYEDCEVFLLYKVVGPNQMQVDWCPIDFSSRLGWRAVPLISLVKQMTEDDDASVARDRNCAESEVPAYAMYMPNEEEIDRLVWSQCAHP